MDILESDSPSSLITLDLDPIDRWNVFNRLQELSIPCYCACGKPLQVTIAGPTHALQVWSVVKRLTLSRKATIEMLETCWRQVARP